MWNLAVDVAFCREQSIIMEILNQCLNFGNDNKDEVDRDDDFEFRYEKSRSWNS